MKVFYNCYGGTHTSVAAAALHTGRLDPRRTPRVRDIVGLPLFDRVPTEDIGLAFPYGRGPDGEDVLVIGFGPGKTVVKRAVTSFLELKGVCARDYFFVDALPRATWAIRVGGTLSRRLGLVPLGRLLAAWGVQRAYDRLVSLVEETRAEVRRRRGGSSLTVPSRGG